MLSYQHAFHAGNLADVHKHGLLAWMLDYLTRKDKPLSYIETHAGRALYDLSAPQAKKTGEAAQGIALAQDWFPTHHPYTHALAAAQAAHGSSFYPGSPWIAQHVSRAQDVLTLAELHPTEAAALKTAMPKTTIHQMDGFKMAHSLLPPTPRRGLMLIDPSYEVKADYSTLPGHMRKWHRAWNVGILVLWYPILTSGVHVPLLDALSAISGALRSEVRFPPAKPGHGMVGSGLFVVNPPFGLEEEAARLKTHFDELNG